MNFRHYHKYFKFLSLDILAIALFLWLIMINFVMPNMPKFQTEVVEQNRFQLDIYPVYYDTDNDGRSEFFQLISDIDKNQIRITSGNEYTELKLQHNFLRRELYFEDVDKDGHAEVFFLTKSADSVLLNILSLKGKVHFLVKDKLLDTIHENFKGTFDVMSTRHSFFYDSNNDNYLEFYINLNADYSYYPRRVYAYDFHNDKIMRSPESGAYSAGIDVFDFNKDGSPDIYFANHATSNISVDCKTCPYPDTLNWLMVLDKKLDFLFPPKPLGTKGSLLRVQPIITDSVNYIAALITNNAYDIPVELFLFDLKGKLIRSKILNNNDFPEVFAFGNTAPDFESIYLRDNRNNLHVFDVNLNLIRSSKLYNSKEVGNSATANYDIDGNGTKELIYIHSKGLIIYKKNFEKFAEVEIDQPYFNRLSFFYKNKDLFLTFRSSKEIWYTLRLHENKWFTYKRWLLSLFLSIIYFLIFTLKAAWIKKIKNDNLKLNRIITERTAEIKEKNKELNKNADFKQSVSSMIAHDLKNSLQSIMVIGKKSSHIDGFRIASNASQMLQLISNFLDTYKYENSQVELNLKKTNITNILTNSIEQLEILAQQKNVQLINSVSEIIKADVDAPILERMFTNLISNAVKFSPMNERIQINCTFYSNKQQEYCKFTIKDNGIGIAADKHKSVFKPYFSEASYFNKSGTGLGLSFCKMMVEAHHGEIGVESSLNKGAEFWFTIPIISHQTIAEHNENTSRNFTFDQFTIQDYEWLHAARIKLENIAFYDYSKLRKLSAQIEPLSPATHEWNEQLVFAIETVNEKYYIWLLNYKHNEL